MSDTEPHPWGEPLDTPPSSSTGGPTPAAPVRPGAIDTPRATPQPRPDEAEPEAEPEPQPRERRFVTAIWSVILAVIILFLFTVGGCVAAITALARPPTAVAEDYLALIDNGEYQAAYEALCPERRDLVDFDTFVAEHSAADQITSYRVIGFWPGIGDQAFVSGTVRLGDDLRNTSYTMQRDELGTWQVCRYDLLQ
ncbi:MAG: hypothetical protein AAF467_21440 [Actinomycetota bacterium]